MLAKRILGSASSCHRRCLRRSFAADRQRPDYDEVDIFKYKRATQTSGQALTSGAQSPQFYFTTFDDNYQKSTVSFVNVDVQGSYVAVNSFLKYGFRLSDGNLLFGPVALFPKSCLSWQIEDVDGITAESLHFFTMIYPKFDVLVIGVGDRENVEPVRRRLAPFFKEHQLNVEVLATEDACATFNYLNSERRSVAAAMIPPKTVLPTKTDRMAMHKFYSESNNLLGDRDLHGFKTTGKKEDTLDKLAGVVERLTTPTKRETSESESNEKNKTDDPPSSKK